LEKFENPTNSPWLNDHIRIDEEEHLALGMAGTMVPCRGRSRIFVKPEHASSHLSGYEGSVIIRCIIHNNDLRSRTGRGFERKKAFIEISSVIVYRYDD
jgi:hypothetical protein